MVNTRRIHNRMQQLGITMDDLAIYMNKNVKNLSQIISNDKPMVLYEAYMIADYLQISTEEICKYFFCSAYAEKNTEDEGVAV